LNIKIAFGSVAIFTILILLVHEDGRSIFWCCLLFFTSVIYNFHCRGLSVH
jgi:hypothetical protein